MNRRQRIFFILTILMLAFIFFQSALPADLSGAESDGLSLFVAHLLHWDEDLATFLVRKAGHFTEYLILGVFLMLAWLPAGGERAKAVKQMASRTPGEAAKKAATRTHVEAGANVEAGKYGEAVKKEENGTFGEAAKKAGTRSLRPVFAWLIGTAYAVTDEIHQLFVEGRSCELRDMGIDSAGVLVGVAIVVAVVVARKRQGDNSTLDN